MAKTKFRLKGHESFVPREGWIAKGIQAVSENPEVFSKRNFYGADAMGVGANMAKSIRYWLMVMGLTTKDKSGDYLTGLGKLILAKDPYIEDMITLWILHYELVNQRELATSWYLFFQQGTDAELTREEYQTYVGQQLMKEFNIIEYVEKSLRDDVSAILNMYCRSHSIEEDFDPEENNISPWNRLGLLAQSGSRFYSVEPDATRIPDEFILYMIYKMIGTAEQSAESIEATKKATAKEKSSEEYSISIDDLYYGIGGVKNSVHMNYIHMNDVLDRLQTKGLIRIDRTAGLDVIYVPAEQSAYKILKNYYGE